jgi:hypothetical protein
MNLPNYFLADLPPEAVLTPELVDEACATLKRNRVRYLEQRSTESIIRVLGRLGREWLNPDYPFRKAVLEHGPVMTGFSTPVLADGLDAMFRHWTEENFLRLVEQEAGHLRLMEEFVSDEEEKAAKVVSTARGPELLVHLTGGVIPNPALMSIALGLLARSAQFVKCATATSWIPRLFAHSLYEIEPKLGACLELAEWKGGTLPLETELFNHADCVTVTGSDETLLDLRRKLPQRARFLGYGHRVSFAYIAHEVFSGEAAEPARQAAADVAAWDQSGCLSPHVIYVETGGRTTPEQFAEALAAALDQIEKTLPRGDLEEAQAAAIANRRTFYEMRAASSRETRLWASPESTAWTVVYENDPQFQTSCLNRFIYVKPVSGLDQMLRGVSKVHGQVSTVGLAAPLDKAAAIALELARWGVTRICPLGQMQNPPLSWRHDGRPSLGDLLTWTNWER